MLIINHHKQQVINKLYNNQNNQFHYNKMVNLNYNNQ